jgi:hypothetical protein
MGCWNGTCGVSQLPITGGTKVKAYLMLQSRSKEVCGSGSCYNTQYFRPWFFPVTAEYNDYGSIEHIAEDWNSKYMLKTFQTWLKNGDVKILGGKDVEINSPEISKFKKLQDVFDCVERGALVVKSDGHSIGETEPWIPEMGYLKIGIFMVLDNIFNDLINEYNRVLALKENKYYYDRDVEEYNNLIERLNKIRTDKIFSNLPIVNDIYIDLMLRSSFDENYAFKHYKSILCLNELSLDDFFKKFKESKAFATAMTYLRKLWIPQTGQGSQSEELSFNKILVSGMNKHIEKREKEIGADD